MSILRVAQAGHPVLRMRSEPVDPEVIPTPEFQGFLRDLLDTMEDYDGAGLAAPQVHEPMRVVVLVLSDERGPEFLINPVVTPVGEEQIVSFEGCLSVPKVRAEVTRHKAIRVEFLDDKGEPQLLELHGYPAIVVQHETDHLDGVLYIDRCDPRTFSYLDEYRRFGGLQFDERGELVLSEEE
ncbi:MAG: peptide deformylase [Deltaproteobacteria bacterium]|nr:peptide deformylase [Deltaproteobacteria bacterium]